MNAPALQVPTKHGTLEIFAPLDPAYSAMLSREALDFVAELSGVFSERILQLLDRRRKRQAQFDSGVRPNFLSETAHLRQGDWTVAPLPADLLDRRVEITGPVSRKMVINALNSGANVFMADFEDSNAPTWSNLVEGQINLRDAVRRNIEYTTIPSRASSYALRDDPGDAHGAAAGLGTSREEHVRLDGDPVPGGAVRLRALLLPQRPRAGRPGHRALLLPAQAREPPRGAAVERRLCLARPAGARDCRRAPSRPRCSSRPCLRPSRWTRSSTSCASTRRGSTAVAGTTSSASSRPFETDPSVVLPDRGQVTMEQPFMRAYTQLVIQTCHRRGVHAMGGMAAQIPIKNDPQANEAALAKVRADKLREVH